MGRGPRAVHYRYGDICPAALDAGGTSLAEPAVGSLCRAYEVASTRVGRLRVVALL